MSVFDDVREFNEACGVPLRSTPGDIPDDELDLALDLIGEEINELDDSISLDLPLSETADAIVDSIYVLIGLGLRMGIPLQAVWDEVQRSNMAKVVDGVVVRDPESNKVLKPAGWRAPDVAGVLKAAS
ncbi:nucleoside triphosphate pyrophosphohydrolase family protein [Rhodococcus sp. BH5]|uniref:nucleoside triphosphate pyrophosphohydrolase family protein n=1 Tax=Rhodococcus sp. BH5 TaxID=2871702 RepID=UPI0022CDA9BA|nr:nucleoside triphosphate pyrophosphohydrolase family protein [Rhodococcus sp. BH5]MCZ9634697.1 nucleoside triphosphate pyrophosphohydrolase family protein [Rhodococcus sp. BH5]